MDITSVLRAHGIGVGKKLVGDAQPSDVRAGKTFSNADGNDKVGTLPVRATSAQTITPGTTNQVLQAGIYDGNITILGDPDLVASNIRSGVNIFGVVGNLVEGKRWAEGTVASMGPSTSRTISGLGFVPRVIIMGYKFNSGDTTSVATISGLATSSDGIEDWTTGNDAHLYVDTKPTGASFTMKTGGAYTLVNIKWIAIE
jgi:hypothetical protein